MDPAILKGLNHVKYENRKAAALELEKLVRDTLLLPPSSTDPSKIPQIIDQLIGLFFSPSLPLHSRNGGLIGVAAAAIALGNDVGGYLKKIVPAVLGCFSDPEGRVRYFACESMYNIAKVCKGEILLYFNECFDALSKLASDSEQPVKNAAELLDRLLKDVVAEAGPDYVSLWPEHSDSRQPGIPYKDTPTTMNTDVSSVSQIHIEKVPPAEPKAFSLARFIPLLSERMYVISPFTRIHLVSWITVLDSVPDLELVSYLPDFLDGLLKYLADPNPDVRISTENVLADFLREIQDIARISKLTASRRRRRASKGQEADNEDSGLSSSAIVGDNEDSSADEGDGLSSWDENRTKSGSWVPGQGVKVDYASIVEILIAHLSYPDDEIQSTSLRWLAEFILITEEVMVFFVPRLIPAILPNLAHRVSTIQSAAEDTSRNLYSVVEALSDEASSQEEFDALPQVVPSGVMDVRSSTSSATSAASYASTVKARTSSTSNNTVPVEFPSSELEDPSAEIMPPTQGSAAAKATTAAMFDYHATVNALTLQLLDDHEETRVAALQWLLMLHQKAPYQIMAMDDGTFPALLKTLSDSSEEVIKHDLRLLAQISSSSQDAYFTSFLGNLLELFSTDRRLLDMRGSLIIRQLCLNLNPERIYRTFAEILEKDEDLEFASLMVQKLSLILITSSELSELRKRLKNLDNKDGQVLFTVIYRSWCHAPVSVFALCLLAQAYEHASNLLQIFADLDITVHMLLQIDKLVQLIESPVFTSLRLQLLEPDKYPHLFKCLYGLLMLLPQSSAFVSLRNRLNAVSSMGFLQISRPTGSKSIPGDEIKWKDLLSHFRHVQARHEKSRRQTSGGDNVSVFSHSVAGSISSYQPPSFSGNGVSSRNMSSTSQRKKATSPELGGRTKHSPLNPKFTPAPTVPLGLGISRPPSPTKTKASFSGAGVTQKFR